MRMNNSQNLAPRLAGRLVVETKTPCPTCSEVEHKNYAGRTPILVRIDDSVRLDTEPDAPFCHVHGYVLD